MNDSGLELPQHKPKLIRRISITPQTSEHIQNRLGETPQTALTKLSQAGKLPLETAWMSGGMITSEINSDRPNGWVEGIRQTDITSIVEAVNSGQNILMTGNYGSGKSSIESGIIAGIVSSSANQDTCVIKRHETYLGQSAFGSNCAIDYTDKQFKIGWGASEVLSLFAQADHEAIKKAWAINEINPIEWFVRTYPEEPILLLIDSIHSLVNLDAPDSEQFKAFARLLDYPNLKIIATTHCGEPATKWEKQLDGDSWYTHKLSPLIQEDFVSLLHSDLRIIWDDVTEIELQSVPLEKMHEYCNGNLAILHMLMNIFAHHLANETDASQGLTRSQQLQQFWQHIQNSESLHSFTTETLGWEQDANTNHFEHLIINAQNTAATMQALTVRKLLEFDADKHHVGSFFTETELDQLRQLGIAVADPTDAGEQLIIPRTVLLELIKECGLKELQEGYKFWKEYEHRESAAIKDGRRLESHEADFSYRVGCFSKANRMLKEAFLIGFLFADDGGLTQAALESIRSDLIAHIGANSYFLKPDLSKAISIFDYTFGVTNLGEFDPRFDYKIEEMLTAVESGSIIDLIVEGYIFSLDLDGLKKMLGTLTARRNGTVEVEDYGLQLNENDKLPLNNFDMSITDQLIDELIDQIKRIEDELN